MTVKKLIPCIITLLLLIEATTANSLHPYIVFLNSSTVSTSSKSSSMSSIQNRSTTRIANKVSHIRDNRTSLPEIYSIGNFHWYVDSMNDADAQALAQSEHVSHLHKDDPIFYMTESVQTDVPSWVSKVFSDGKARSIADAIFCRDLTESTSAKVRTINFTFLHPQVKVSMSI